MPRIQAASIDEHKSLTRKKLLECARTLVAEAGSVDIALGEVAFGAGVGRTTFYDYFVDREDLIASLVEEELPSVLGAIIESTPRLGSPPSRLAHLVDATVRFVATDPVLGVILHRDAGRMTTAAQERIRVAHAALSDEMVGIYYAGVETGEFRVMPPGLAGSLIQDVIMSGAKAVMRVGNDVSKAEELTDSLVTFLMGGLRDDVDQER